MISTMNTIACVVGYMVIALWILGAVGFGDFRVTYRQPICKSVGGFMMGKEWPCSEEEYRAQNENKTDEVSRQEGDEASVRD